MNNQEEILNNFKNEIQSWMLEQNVSSLENSLSQTISFFQLAMGIAAVIIILVAWWMNKLFSNKLDEVKEKSKEVERKLEEIKQKETNIVEKYEDIYRIHNSIKEWENYKKSTDETIEGLRLWSKMLEEAISIQIEVNEFKRIEEKVNEIEKTITQGQIKQFPWEDMQMSPNKNFTYHKSYFTEAQNFFERAGIEIRDFLDFEEFVNDLDSGYEKLSGELHDFLTDAKDYMQLLLKINKY